MKFIVLHPEAYKPEVVEYKNLVDCAENEFESKRISSSNTLQMISQDIYPGNKRSFLVMIEQPLDFTTKDTMMQNICLDDKRSMNTGGKKLIYGTVAFVREDSNLRIASVNDEDIEKVKDLMKENLSMNELRYLRLKALTNEQNREPVSALQVKDGIVKEVKIQGIETIMGEMGCRNHIPPTVYNFKDFKNFVVFDSQQNNEGIELDVKGVKVKCSNGCILAKKDERFSFLEMTSEEKQQMRKELASCMINKKNVMDISVNKEDGNQLQRGK